MSGPQQPEGWQQPQPGGIPWWEGYGEPEIGEHDVIAPRPCYMCEGPLVLSDRAEPGHPYPYRCRRCGGQCTAWFAADGTEYNDFNDDRNGRLPWAPDYEGPVPPRGQWSVDWSEVPLPETPLCRGCAARLTGWQPPAGYVVTAIGHEPGCLQLAAMTWQLPTLTWGMS